MQMIFTAVAGRSGTTSLAYLLNTYGISTICEHEPPDLLLRQLARTQMFRRMNWFTSNPRLLDFGRGFQRRYIVTNEMLGRGKALEYSDKNDTQKLGKLVDKRLARLRRFSRKSFQHYVESSQLFLRTFADETVRRVPDLGIIKLTRDPLKNARSLANRNRPLFQRALPPDRPSNLFRIEKWQQMSAFQLSLVQWIETQLRYQAFVDKNPAQRVFEIATEELSNRDRVAEMFAFFGMEHRPLTDLAPRNTNAEVNLPETSVTEQDVKEYHEVLELLPKELFDRIEYLRGYEPKWA